jgi:tetratricopeptide (TPR) repeat protein
MRSLRNMMTRSLLTLSLVVLLLALAFWTIRPSPYGEWLGLAGLNKYTPLYLIQEWANRRVGPTTPLGLLSQFPSDDLWIAGALLVAIGIVLVLLGHHGRGGQAGSGLTRRIRLLRPRGISLRVRTVLVLIAILALELGWEVVAWRAWRLREIYLAQKIRIISNQKSYRDNLNRTNAQLANLEAGLWLFGDQTMYTAEAKAASLSYYRDRLMRELSYNAAFIAYYDDKLLRKYEAAAEDPLRPIPPDPPPPESRSDGDPYSWLINGNYERALTGFDELIRLYPDYPEAHDRRAWLLATSPLEMMRNGKLAVMEARRACELTSWKAPWFFPALAAAYAEAGDFASAISWEQKARESGTRQFGSDKDPLTFYKAGKPFRLPLQPGPRMPSSAASEASSPSSGIR